MSCEFMFNYFEMSLIQPFPERETRQVWMFSYDRGQGTPPSACTLVTLPNPSKSVNCYSQREAEDAVNTSMYHNNSLCQVRNPVHTESFKWSLIRPNNRRGSLHFRFR